MQAQLDALIQTRVHEDGDTLNPESITVLDPACGSGHILVVAYDVLKAIYLERGYQPRAIPRLILEKNLYGLDIDDRAAQMAGFALLMKARADDRRLFDNPPLLNVLALQESKGLNANEIVQALNTVRAELVEASLIRQLIDTFAHAKTFGSLIKIPLELNAQLATMAEGLQQVIQNGDLYAKAAAQDLLPLVQQARVLGMQFDAVVANPPYMGGKGMNPELKDYAKTAFTDSKSDLFAMFMERGFEWCKASGFNSMVTMQSWMFLSSYEAMREKLLQERTLSCMVHMGNGVMGIAFGTAATVLLNGHVQNYAGSFSYCNNDDVSDEGVPKNFPVQNERLKNAKPDDFKKIPGSPVAYWLSKKMLACYEGGGLIANEMKTAIGLNTGDNNRFIRRWFEIGTFSDFGYESMDDLSIRHSGKWVPYNKGGDFRKWFGNREFVINWEADGKEIKEYAVERNDGKHWSRYIQNLPWMCKRGLTWTFISSSNFGIRLQDKGFLFDVAGSCAFPKNEQPPELYLGLLGSKISFEFLKAQNPTLNFQASNVGGIPWIPPKDSDLAIAVVRELVDIYRLDWDRFETSWGFSHLDLIGNGRCSKIADTWHTYKNNIEDYFDRGRTLEQENNRTFIDAYDLLDEFSPLVSEAEITLYQANREKDCQRLISYAIGCMMGRYSLDEPGLIYAHAANAGFDATRYPSFPADADGIVPLTDELWFEDDAGHRIREFLLTVWGAETLEENVVWLAESLGTKATETPDETIRRYLSGSFFKNHLQAYKKRPIYWLFSSGKQGAFQALVYLHRYHEGTLARLRAEYVVPLTGKIQSRIEMLQKDASAASSTAARNKLAKEVEKLKKKHVELLAYDEQLRHYADMRITLDLDDGVKVNYGKFGDLLAEVKAVTGGAGDD